MRRLTLGLLFLASLVVVHDAGAQSRVVIDHPGRFNAAVADIGATLTEIVAAPTGGQSVYVTAIVLVSATATGGSFALRSGTGTNCGTGTTGLVPQPGVASPTLTFNYPANTATPLVINFSPPAKAPASAALCVIGVATNVARGQVLGFVGP